MSNIDLSNPKVLKNYMLAQAREGKGEIYDKPSVKCFKNEDGFEFVIPDECIPEFETIGKTEYLEASDLKVDEIKVADAEEDMKTLRKLYKEKTGKNLSPRYMNDRKWILDNIN